MQKDNTSPFKQFSQSFQIPVSAVYLGLVIIISLAGLVVVTGAMQQPQDSRSQAAGEYNIVGCNQICEHNHQCQPNHFCYKGRCRLADNPESINCDPTELPDPTQTQSDLSGRKGAPVDLGPDATNGATQTSPTPIDQLIKQPIATPTPEPKTGILSTIQQTLNNFSQQLKLPLPVLVGIGVGGLILIIAIVALANAGKTQEPYQPPSFDDLEKSNKVQMPPQKPQQTKETTQQGDDQSPPPSSMVSRLKEKGVQPPDQDN